jgi:hypothetical protein
MLLTGRVSPLRRQAGGMRRHCSFPRLCRPGHTGTTPAGRRVPWRVRACTAEARNHRSSRGVLVRLPKEKARAINLTAAGSVGGAAGGVGYDFEDSIVFARNYNWATNSVNWKWIKFRISIPWAAKHGGVWNPIQLGPNP